jgi:hypothetical protein
MKISNHQQHYKCKIGTNGIIYGNVDGIVKLDGMDTLLEIKVRSSNKSKIQPYEHIQIQMYMMISKMKACVFVECLENGNVEITFVEYNVDYCDTILQNLLMCCG